MHPKHPIPDAQKTDIIYHWKCPAYNCIAEYIGPWKEESQTIEIKPTVPSETTTSQQNTQKQNLKDLTIIDRDSNTLHHQAKEALHIHIKDPSLNRNIGKVRFPPVFNKISQTSHTTRNST